MFRTRHFIAFLLALALIYFPLPLLRSGLSLGVGFGADVPVMVENLTVPYPEHFV